MCYACQEEECRCSYYRGGLVAIYSDNRAVWVIYQTDYDVEVAVETCREDAVRLVDRYAGKEWA